MEWIDRLAEGIGLEPLTGQEATRLLAASREVAHRVERKVTPLAAFLIGMGVSKRIADGDSRAVAFDQALDALLRRLPDAPPEEPKEDGG